ncbi:MAG: GHKL domain-containing protein [Proteobacteria bacterium]|nr:MAG: GHKL domain-containing protein [Pseudomonadota bacterium]
MMSLSARIALSAALVLAIFVALTAIALDRAFRDSARSATQTRLLGQIYLLMAAAEVDTQGQLSMPPTLQEPRFTLPGSGLYAQVLDGNNDVVWRSHSTISAQVPFSGPFPAGTQDFAQRHDSNDRPYYVLSYGISWATDENEYPFTFAVVEDLAAFYTQVKRYRRSLWGWLGTMAVLLLLVQALVFRWGLAPLRRVSQELAAIDAGTQDRLQGEYPRELKRLTNNVNDLLEHERAQQQRYRNGLADLAHSLKTPLAVLRAASGGKPTKAELASALEREITRMDHIVEYQLQKAATVGRATLATPIAIKPIVLKLIESLDKVHHQKALEVVVSVDDDTRFRGDEGDLMEMLGNLIDNAYKWCIKKIRVFASAEEGSLVIKVEDDGPGIDPNEITQILRRGTRADEAVPGHGIGLAVVCDMVQAYDGTIEIGASELGGTEIRLTLPSP